uniref:Uncharacterized protein n=1 Tax=Chromera velia CCMP2878 TaxID=1169474 RepID=A0A0G4GVA0_9ALVE|eukprot:Cvel_23472.t1-p1 / transcript=Cvel_23472.t1 / gene=Cvel_23472 / organism=Chromera_velia_CCMP2878 / gene_product=hypothetical protein / transcript_product=hypothetical protein / location=Cvel_scaffold2422:14125-17988(-) / protein_length=641 / sequence_SO=supercontig / SO=protein_coding / is_pseudo=false
MSISEGSEHESVFETADPYADEALDEEEGWFVDAHALQRQSAKDEEATAPPPSGEALPSATPDPVLSQLGSAREAPKAPEEASMPERETIEQQGVVEDGGLPFDFSSKDREAPPEASPRDPREMVGQGREEIEGKLAASEVPYKEKQIEDQTEHTAGEKKEEVAEVAESYGVETVEEDAQPPSPSRENGDEGKEESQKEGYSAITPLDAPGAKSVQTADEDQTKGDVDGPQQSDHQKKDPPTLGHEGRNDVKPPQPVTLDQGKEAQRGVDGTDGDRSGVFQTSKLASALNKSAAVSLAPTSRAPSAGALSRVPTARGDGEEDGEAFESFSDPVPSWSCLPSSFQAQTRKDAFFEKVPIRLSPSCRPVPPSKGQTHKSQSSLGTALRRDQVIQRPPGAYPIYASSTPCCDCECDYEGEEADRESAQRKRKSPQGLSFKSPTPHRQLIEDEQPSLFRHQFASRLRTEPQGPRMLRTLTLLGNQVVQTEKESRGMTGVASGVRISMDAPDGLPSFRSFNSVCASFSPPPPAALQTTGEIPQPDEGLTQTQHGPDRTLTGNFFPLQSSPPLVASAESAMMSPEQNETTPASLSKTDTALQRAQPQRAQTGRTEQNGGGTYLKETRLDPPAGPLSPPAERWGGGGR